MENQNPNEQNLQISLLKNNLDTFKNEFIAHHAEISSLDADNEQCYQQAMLARRKVIAFNAKAESIKAENINLQVKRQAQLDKLARIRTEIGDACATRDEIHRGLEQDEQHKLNQLRRYQDALREIADRYRNAPAFYDEVEIKKQIESDEKTLSEMQIEKKKLQERVAELRCKINNIKPSIPENILDIVGQNVLKEKLKALTAECENIRANIIR